MNIRPMTHEDMPKAAALWNACVSEDEVLYTGLSAEAFEDKFEHTDGCEPQNLLAAVEGETLLGFAHCVAPGSFTGAKPGAAYLTTILVDKAHRGQGVGKALLDAVEEAMRARGAETLSVSSLNPVNLNWRIPGTPGHDHNNMPGVDIECTGAGFLKHNGFANLVEEVAMYIDLSTYRAPADLNERREALRAQGIETGVYDASLHCGFDGMCDRVGSDYWRDVLRTEIAAWEGNRPNSDPRFFVDGVEPAGPRPLLTATHEGQIIGFTGPVDQQRSGRGWFTGICTDPLYGGRGIATVLFNLLMQAFVDEGAAFSTLFTGMNNPAKRIYERAGMRPARRFALMRKSL